MTASADSLGERSLTVAALTGALCALRHPGRSLTVAALFGVAALLGAPLVGAAHVSKRLSLRRSHSTGALRALRHPGRSLTVAALTGTLRALRHVALILLIANRGMLAQELGAAPLTLTLQDALARARQYAQQVYTASIGAQIAHEDTVQARAGLLPVANGFSQYIYTQGNGTPSGVFVPNDGVHIYNDQAQVHGDIYNPAKRADYHRIMATEALARAKADLAARGVVGTVVQNYYGMVAGQRKIANAQQSVNEAQSLLDITQKQEAGGEVSHYDVVKAQIQVEDRRRDLQEAQLALEKLRLGFAVLLFPNFGQSYSVVDDLATVPILPPFSEIQAMAGNNSPDVRAAQATVQQQTYATASAKAAYLPSLSFDYFFGISANQFAVHDPEGNNRLGSVAQAQLNIPIWTWGAQRSKVRQAELQLQLAKNDLSFTQRQLLAELNQFYREAQIANTQTASLRRSLDLAAEGLRLTMLRYQAGEATILEVADAQTTLVQARNANDDGQVRYRLALANLQTLTGVF